MKNIFNAWMTVLRAPVASNKIVPKKTSVDHGILENMIIGKKERVLGVDLKKFLFPTNSRFIIR